MPEVQEPVLEHPASEAEEKVVVHKMDNQNPESRTALEADEREAVAPTQKGDIYRLIMSGGMIVGGKEAADYIRRNSSRPTTSKSDHCLPDSLPQSGSTTQPNSSTATA